MVTQDKNNIIYRDNRAVEDRNSLYIERGNWVAEDKNSILYRGNLFVIDCKNTLTTFYISG